jgi:hypothetical protein
MFLPAYQMTNYVFEVNFVPDNSKGSFGLALNTKPDLSVATGSTKVMAYSKDYGSDSKYVYYQNKYSSAADTTSYKVLRDDVGVAVPEAGKPTSFKAYVIDGTCYWYIDNIAVTSFAIESPLTESRPAIFTCGAAVTVTSVKLNKLTSKTAEDTYANVEFTEGKVIFETDFEGDEYVKNQLPEGWWAAFKGKDGLSYGWVNPSYQAYVNAAITELPYDITVSGGIYAICGVILGALIGLSVFLCVRKQKRKKYTSTLWK